MNARLLIASAAQHEEHWQPRSPEHLAGLLLVADVAPRYLQALVDDTLDESAEVFAFALMRRTLETWERAWHILAPVAQPSAEHLRALYAVADAAWVLHRQMQAHAKGSRTPKQVRERERRIEQTIEALKAALAELGLVGGGRG